MSQPKKPSSGHRHYYDAIGLHIAYFRRKAHLTQAQLAELAGISEKYMSMIETATFKNPPSLEVLFALADALHVTPGNLIDGPEASKPCPFLSKNDDM